jgi:hypothetical protein
MHTFVADFPQGEQTPNYNEKRVQLAELTGIAYFQYEQPDLTNRNTTWKYVDIVLHHYGQNWNPTKADAKRTEYHIEGTRMRLKFQRLPSWFLGNLKKAFDVHDSCDNHIELNGGTQNVFGEEIANKSPGRQMSVREFLECASNRWKALGNPAFKGAPTIVELTLDGDYRVIKETHTAVTLVNDTPREQAQACVTEIKLRKLQPRILAEAIPTKRFTTALNLDDGDEDDG